jgi:hypothetical protein
LRSTLKEMTPMLRLLRQQQRMLGLRLTESIHESAAQRAVLPTEMEEALAKGFDDDAGSEDAHAAPAVTTGDDAWAAFD